MKDGKETVKPDGKVPPESFPTEKQLNPSWHAFIRYCTEMGHGEIELLKIQDGLPVLAEKIKQKVKFS